MRMLFERLGVERLIYGRLSMAPVRVVLNHVGHGHLVFRVMKHAHCLGFKTALNLPCKNPEPIFLQSYTYLLPTQRVDLRGRSLEQPPPAACSRAPALRRACPKSPKPLYSGVGWNCWKSCGDLVGVEVFRWVLNHRQNP